MVFLPDLINKALLYFVMGLSNYNMDFLVLLK